MATKATATKATPSATTTPSPKPASGGAKAPAQLVDAKDFAALAAAIYKATPMLAEVKVRVSPDGRQRLVSGGWLRVDMAVQEFCRRKVNAQSPKTQQLIARKVKEESGWVTGKPYGAQTYCARAQVALIAVLAANNAVSTLPVAPKVGKAPVAPKGKGKGGKGAKEAPTPKGKAAKAPKAATEPKPRVPGKKAAARQAERAAIAAAADALLGQQPQTNPEPPVETPAAPSEVAIPSSESAA